MLLKLKACIQWMTASPPWRGVGIVVVALTVYSLASSLHGRFGPVAAGAIDVIRIVAVVVAAIGLFGYVRWWNRRRVSWLADKLRERR